MTEVTANLEFTILTTASGSIEPAVIRDDPYYSCPPEDNREIKVNEIYFRGWKVTANDELQEAIDVQIQKFLDDPESYEDEYSFDAEVTVDVNDSNEIFFNGHVITSELTCIEKAEIYDDVLDIRRSDLYDFTNQILNCDERIKFSNLLEKYVSAYSITLATRLK